MNLKEGTDRQDEDFLFLSFLSVCFQCHWPWLQKLQVSEIEQTAGTTQAVDEAAVAASVTKYNNGFGR